MTLEDKKTTDTPLVSPEVESFIKGIDPHKGLSEKQVEESRRKFGSNSLTPPPRTPLWMQFLEKFKDPTIILLSVAAFISIFIGVFRGHFIEGIGIIAAIIIATGVGFYSEYKSNREFDLLNQTKEEKVKILRDGMFHTIMVQEVVVGDLVILNLGDRVPADGRIVETTGLYVDQSMLTGESVPVKKSPKPPEESLSGFPSNMVFRGTLVSDGTGKFVVTTVGDNTEMGKIASSMAEESEVQTPLQERLEGLSKLIGYAGMSVAGLIFLSLTVRFFILGKFTGWNLNSLEHFILFFMIAVTIIVVAVPEGLPMMVTMSLAFNMRKMARANCLVKKLEASETIGSVTVICTDKTGTLTQNKMKPVRFFVGGETCQVEAMKGKIPDAREWQDIIDNSAINSTANLEFKDGKYLPVGNPTEGALLGFLNEHGIHYEEIRDNTRIVRQIPFSSERKKMTTLVENRDGFLCYEKGAPNMLLEECSHIMINGEIKPIDEYREKIEEFLRKSSWMAHRVLGFTKKYVKTRCSDDMECCHLEHDHILDGLVSISDPLRPQVFESVEACRNAGIDVKMLTGDDKDTAVSIARECEILNNNDDIVLSHDEFVALSDEELDSKVDKIKVLARSRPLDKLRLVKSLHNRNQVVGVTGDGTNDAPALKRADVGIAMGNSGTEVANEAADIVLVDDNFKSIVNGILWGRTIYENIQRLIVFQLTVNVAALAVAFLGPFLGIDLPLTVIQLLWVNIIMDTFAALALSSEPPKKETLSKPPRPRSESIITPTMASVILITGSFMTLCLLVLLKTKFLGSTSVREAQTVIFTTFVMFQFWNEFNCRSLNIHQSPFEGLSKNKAFLLIVGIILIIQILVVNFGGELFRTTPLPLIMWVKIMLLTATILPVGRLARWIAYKLFEKKTGQTMNQES